MTYEPLIHTDYFNGVAVWRIDAPAVSAVISQHGGQLLAWQPRGHAPVLWYSPCSRLPPHPLRGGVPVCWPYFGRQGQASDVPQHGHARISAWQCGEVTPWDEGGVQVDLVLPPDPRTPLRLRQRLCLGASLEQELITTYPGARGDPAITFTQALHSYFAVGDADQVSVSGVEGLHYVDKFDGADYRQAGPWQLLDQRDPGRSDRLYRATGQRFTVDDPVGQRRIDLHTWGSRSLVIWNPGQTGSAAIADLPPSGWRQFVCVEAANAGDDAVCLPTGAEHRLGQRLILTRT